MSGPYRPASRPRSPRPAGARPAGKRFAAPRGGGGGSGGSGGWLLLAFLLLALGGFTRNPGEVANSVTTATPTPAVSTSPSTGAGSTPAPTPTATAKPTATATPTPTASSGGDTALDFLDGLATAAERRDGYSRELFRHWVDADGDGCNTRYEVLIAESRTTVTVGGGCAISGGSWLSPYDGVETADPRTLDIDHLVPLAEAWDSGAYAWSAGRREAYANDLGDARALIAVSASSNRAKSDGDPAEWLPTVKAYWCTYASEWVAVKARWGLAVDAAERARLEEILRGCPATPISVFPA